MSDNLLEYCDRVIWIAIILFVVFSTSSITGAQSALILAVLAWAVKMILARDFGLTKTPLNLPIAAFLAANILSLVNAADFANSLYELKSLALIVLYFLIVDNIKDKAKIIRIINLLIIFTTLAALYGIFQHFTGIDFFGHTRHLHGTLCRCTGFFGQPITFGEYLSMVLIMALMLLFAASEKKRRFLFGLSIPIIFAGLVFTYSRAAWVGLLAGITTIGVLNGKRALLVLSVGVVLICITLAFFPKLSVTKRAISILDLAYWSGAERTYLWRSSLKIIKDHPITGVGVDGFRKVYPQYILPQAKEPHLTHPHNTFLGIAVECGILGLAAFLWFLVTLFKMTLDVFRKTSDKYLKAVGLGCFGAFSAFVVSGLTEYNFGDSEVVVLFYLFMGLTMVIHKMCEEGEC